MIYVSSALKIRILNRLGLLSLFRIGYKAKVLKHVFNIPIIENKEGLIYHLNINEPYLLHVFQLLNNSGKFFFLDAGVNFGQTLLKIKAVNPSIGYLGFEPSGLCSYYASHLIKVNNFRNSRVIRCALSNSMGVLTLHSQSDGDTRATILDNIISKEEDAFQELVPVVTLDSLIPVISAQGENFILKVDVEGAELLVFKGAEQFINEYRPIVVFENLPSNKSADKSNEQQELSIFFINKNYHLFLMDEKKWKLEKLESIANEADFSETNYIAIPDEKIIILNDLINSSAK